MSRVGEYRERLYLLERALNLRPVFPEQLAGCVGAYAELVPASIKPDRNKRAYMKASAEIRAQTDKRVGFHNEAIVGVSDQRDALEGNHLASRSTVGVTALAKQASESWYSLHQY